MTLEKTQVTDEELHALVDGQLQEPRRSEVAACLEKDPELAQKAGDYRRLNQSLHDLYDPVLNEGVPLRLRQPAPDSARRPLMHAAMAAGLVLFGGVMGWTLNGQLQPQRQPVFMTDLIRPAAFAHTVYTPDVRHPVEVPADQEAHLVNWLSKRLQTPVQAPNLQQEGFDLVGGRLLPSTGRMAAQFMYEDGTGNRITLYLRKGNWGNKETAFRYAHEKGVGVFFWIDGPVGYALSGELPRERLLRLASVVYQEINP